MKDTSIKIKVLSCRNLQSNSRSGMADPYCQLRIGKLKQVTKVIPKTLTPCWNQEFVFNITPALLEANLLISLWDKDLFTSNFMGFVEFAVSDLLTMHRYDSAHNEPEWYPLLARSPKEIIFGDICLQIGVDGDLDTSYRLITECFSKLNLTRNASLISSDDPSDMVFFNHMVNVANPEEAESSTKAESSMKSSESPSLASSTLTDNNVVPLDHNLAGLLLIDVIGARNLPYEKSALKNSFNCDPFVVVSFGKTVYRTKIVRHNLNPDWNQAMHFHLKQSDLQAGWPLDFNIYDFERFTKNNAICEVETHIPSLIDACEKPVRNANKPTIYPHREIILDLKIKNSKPIKPDLTKTPHLIIHCSFIPYVEIRRNFWMALMQNYESTSPNDPEKRIDKVSFVTMLDEIACNFSDETINAMFASQGKSPADELTFSEAIDCLESKIRNLSIHNFGIETERLMMIKHCPICKKGFDQRGDFDIVSHLALCSHGQLDKLDSLAMGGFLTQESASSKWFTKILSYVTFGGLGIGKNSGHILYQDRASGQIVKEKIPTYIRLGIRLLYQIAGSKSAVESKSIKRLLKTMTLKQGIKFEHPSSVKHIAQFIAYHNLDLDEVLDPIDSFKNFNEFFYRKLKPGARTLASENKEIVVCPADARTNCFASIKRAQEFWIKGSKFTLEGLLGSAELAQTFHEGSIAVCRLAPQDYHRFHWPVDGKLLSSQTIEGTYFTVNPMAVRTTVDVFTENVRNVCIIQSEVHGKVAFVSVGAMLVGSIVITSQVGQTYKRMDEHGYFKFGGSTIILLFEKDRVVFDTDLLSNSSSSLETLCKFGTSMGSIPKQ